jgi:CIC family chloride channel protein
VELRAGLIGATVGVLAWFLPDLVGGGHDVMQGTLAGEAVLTFLHYPT